MNCEQCGGTNPELISSSLLSDGSRRRRYGCRRCKHRWTAWTGDRPNQASLTVDQVRLILTRVDLSDSAMAKQMGRTRESVRQVRVGISFSDVCPELPRRNAVEATLKISCLSCRNWRGERGCGFELPDPVEEGIGFAVDCVLYAT